MCEVLALFPPLPLSACKAPCASRCPRASAHLVLPRQQGTAKHLEQGGYQRSLCAGSSALTQCAAFNVSPALPLPPNIPGCSLQQRSEQCSLGLPTALPGGQGLGPAPKHQLYRVNKLPLLGRGLLVPKAQLFFPCGLGSHSPPGFPCGALTSD